MDLSRREIREEIAKLNRLDPRRAEYSYIHHKYQSMTGGLAIVVGLAGGGELFYRVRRTNGSKPSLVTDFHAPPAEAVTGYQRCNPPNLPMFYTASKRIGALIESRVEEGEIVYLSQWIGKNQIPVNRVFDTPENQEMPGVDVSTIGGPNDDIILAHFDTFFTRRIHSTFSDDYKFTAAIAQYLTANFPVDGPHDIHDDGYVALKYPGVFRPDEYHNTAMHPSFALERLELLHVMELRVLSSNQENVSVEILDTATRFEGGNIDWSGSINSIPTLLNDQRSVPFIYDGKRWNLELYQDSVTQQYIDSLMND